MSLAHVNVDEGNLPLGSYTRDWWYHGFYVRWDETSIPRAYAVFRREQGIAGLYQMPALCHCSTTSAVNSFIQGFEMGEGTWSQEGRHE